MSTGVVTAAMLASLPEPVRRYLEFSGVVGKPLIRTVTVKQTGKIRQSSEKPWMRFRATETYSLDPPGFVWKAKAYRGGLPLLTVRDSYVEGRGGMRVRLAGLFPIVNASGPELDHSSAVRFLNEMMWFPSAFLRPNITWTAIDDTSAEVWSTPITAYGTFCGLRLPAAGQAVWHLESGDFTYIDLRVEEITYSAR